MNTAIVTASDKVFEITDTGLTITGYPTYEQWIEFGQKLSRSYSRIQWSIGDWINEGENRYGEMYAQALDSHIYNYGTLRNYASVCARIPKHIRSPKLRFHQQKHVAPLEPHEQKRILDFAAEKNLSGDDIQEIVARTLGKQPGQRTETGHDSDNAPGLLATVSRKYFENNGAYLTLKLNDGRMPDDIIGKSVALVIISD